LELVERYSEVQHEAAEAEEAAAKTPWSLEQENAAPARGDLRQNVK
jgi:hypothetical protein